MRAVMELHDVQAQIDALKIRRDSLIRESVAEVAGVRSVARFVGMSPAQVSRISRAVTQKVAR